MEQRPENAEEQAARGNQNTHIAEACGYIKNPDSLLAYKNYADAVRKLSGYHVRCSSPRCGVHLCGTKGTPRTLHSR